ncbi:MAG TPA: riboflavin synthase [Dehalococcoidales bacterium]|nr:riboflavin synthase [Dehalococcoidales bacterium]
MFTGIVEEVGKVASVAQGKLAIAASRVLPGLELGSSVSVNGVCLTVTGLASGTFTVDVMPETTERSNLGLLSVGDSVNLEKSLAFGGPMGGHLVQGHIDATGRLASMRRDGEAMIMRFEAPPEVMRYVVEKGFIAVDGISLTVMARDEDSFQVSVVNFSRQSTILGSRRIGDRVNLEVDIIAKYVEKFSQPRREAVTEGFLRQHGFLVR